MTRRWHEKKSEHVTDPLVDAFLAEIIEVCKKHGFSIAHEDSGGGFLIEEFKPGNIEWLEEAAINTGKYPSQQ